MIVSAGFILAASVLLFTISRITKIIDENDSYII